MLSAGSIVVTPILKDSRWRDDDQVGAKPALVVDFKGTGRGKTKHYFVCLLLGTKVGGPTDEEKVKGSLANIGWHSVENIERAAAKLNYDADTLGKLLQAIGDTVHTK